jgi:transcriptional regulator with XRE-family HTH domain
MTRPVPFQTKQAAVSIGEHLSAWRKLRGMTAQQVAERAGTTRQTLARLERGDASVGLDIFFNISRALGLLDTVVTATDPYETPFGRARADQTLPRRVRQ